MLTNENRNLSAGFNQYSITRDGMSWQIIMKSSDLSCVLVGQNEVYEFLRFDGVNYTSFFKMAASGTSSGSVFVVNNNVAFYLANINNYNTSLGSRCGLIVIKQIAYVIKNNAFV